MDGSPPWRMLEPPSPAATEPEPEATSPTARRSLGVWLGLAGAAGLVVMAAAVAIGSTAGASIEVTGDAVIDATATGESIGAEVVVEVSGAVRQPGVYRLPGGSRVADAIAAAGGYGPRVAADRAAAELDLAARLVDGGTVVVPSRDDPAGGAPGPTGGAATAVVDLNHATAAELEALPGIGPVTAGKIVAARTEQPFGSVDELRDRGLVGAKTFDRLHDLVTVR